MKKMVFIFCLLGLFCFSNSFVMATPVTIYSEGFETNPPYKGWTVKDWFVGWYSGTPKFGAYDVILIRKGNMEKTISTKAKEDIVVSFDMGAYSLDNERENVQALWFNGISWEILAQINDGQDDNQLHHYQFNMPDGANDNENFKLKFKLNGSFIFDYGFVDNILVSGEPITGQDPPDTGTLPASMSLESVDTFTVPYENNIPYPSFDYQDSSYRTTINLAGIWKKQRQSLNHQYSLDARDATGLGNIITEANGRNLETFDDSGWPTITLPAVENTMPGYESGDGPENYQDGVWYRRTFTVDSGLDDKFARLKFMSVNYTCDVWINGTYAGYHEGGYTPFAFDVTPLLNYNSENVIAIRVDNPPWGSRNDMVPAVATTDWTNYTGIIQDMFIEFSNKLSIARVDVVPQDVEGNINVKAVVQNETGTQKADIKAEIQVYTADDQAPGYYTDPKASAIVGSSATLGGTTSITYTTIDSDTDRVYNMNASIDNPNLWSTGNPNLYVLKVILKEGTTIIDTFHTQFGIRKVDVGVDAKILLNEEPVFFTGVGRHEEWHDSGRTATMAKTKSDLDVINDNLNVNLIRPGHYPNSMFFYTLTDRMGFATIAEVPCWQFDYIHYMEQDTRRIADQMWREMIFSNYNNPSILFWSTNNESRETKWRKWYIERIVADYKDNYNDGRLTTQASAADAPGPDDITQEAVDVPGWNTYFGIFHGGNYYKGTADFLETAHKNFPSKPIMIWETGLWSETAGTTNGSNEADQVECAVDTTQAVLERAAVDNSGQIRTGGYVASCVWFSAFNWYTGNTYKVQTMGLYHMDRYTAKPAKATVANLFASYNTMDEVQSAINFQSFENTVNYTQQTSTAASVDTARSKSGTSSLKLTISNTGVVDASSRCVDISPETGTYVDFSTKDYLTFWLFDSVGNNTPRITFKDNNGLTYSEWSASASVKNEWAKIVFPLSIIKSSQPDFDYTEVKEISIGEFTQGDYWIDDIRASVLNEDTYFFQNFDNTNDDSKLFSAGSDSIVTRAGDIKYTGKHSIKMVTASSGDPDSMQRSVKVLPYYGKALNLSDANYLGINVYDTNGSNTIKVYIKDKNNNSWNGWTDNGSTQNQWSRCYINLSNVTGVDLANILDITLGQWNSGTYYFDDIIYSDNNKDEAEELIGHRSFQAFELMDDIDRVALETEGAAVSFDSSIVRSGNRSLKVELSTGQLPDHTRNSAMLCFNDPGIANIDINAYGTLSFYVYDTVGSNTCYFELEDQYGSKWNVWSTQQTIQNQWTRVDISLDALGGINQKDLKYVYFGMYNAGTYYIDDILLTSNPRREIPQARIISYQDFEDSNGSAQYFAGTDDSISTLSTTEFNEGQRGAVLEVTEAGWPSEYGKSIKIYPQNTYGKFNLFDVDYIKIDFKDTVGINTLHIALFDDYKPANYTRIWTSSDNPSILNQWTQIILPKASIRGQYMEENECLIIGEYNTGNYFIDGIKAIILD